MNPKILPGGTPTFRTAAIVSSLPVIPFMILESVNGSNLPQDFPIVLFALMWLMTLSFVLVLMSLRRGLESGRRTKTNVIKFVSKTAVLLLIAGMWIGIIRDQMPCFLGVPNCD